MVCLAKAASHCPWLPLVPWSLAPGRRSLWRQPPKPSVSRKTTWYSPERFLAAHKIVETSLTESEGNCTTNLRYLTVFCTFQAALHPPVLFAQHPHVVQFVPRLQREAPGLGTRRSGILDML